MAMTKVLGANLAAGVTASGIGGVHEQSATKTQAGEIKAYKDKDGNYVSAYAVDRHEEYSFEGIIKSGVKNKKVGDKAKIGGVTGVITKWEVIESNEDVKKVSVSLRSYEGLT